MHLCTVTHKTADPVAQVLLTVPFAPERQVSASLRAEHLSTSRAKDAIGVDPFSISEDALFPVTFGDFVELYEKTAQQA